MTPIEANEVLLRMSEAPPFRAVFGGRSSLAFETRLNIRVSIRLEPEHPVRQDLGGSGFLNINRQRWLDRVLGAPVCWLVTILHRLRRPETAPRDVQRILIIVLSEMGALVLTRPMFDRLRTNHPSATFYLLCSEKNEAVLDLLDEVPPERVITVRSGSLITLAADGVRAVRRMRALRLDAVLDLELFARVSAILAGLSGARSGSVFIDSLKRVSIVATP